MFTVLICNFVIVRLHEQSVLPHIYLNIFSERQIYDIQIRIFSP